MPHDVRLHPSIATPLGRTWQNQGRVLSKGALMYPIFITDEPGSKIPLGSMPNQYRWSVDRLSEFLGPLVERGLQSVILFGVPVLKEKDEVGSLADDADGPVIQAIKYLREHFPTLYIAADVCLCEYTSHGHCGVLCDDGTVNNDESTKRLADVALAYAKAGAHCVAPSDMMDGRIASISAALRAAGYGGKTTLMAYSAKFASGMYGPFRDAVASAPSFGDRRCYQLPPNARGLARRAIARDVAEGADIVMVKPALPYLDIIGDAREIVPDYPLACYQVSGEYAMLHAAAAAGIADLRRVVEESMTSMMRAGASIILTYFTPELLEWIDSPVAA
ncbi:porphobilinogen synthase [Malassezia cuniculi]|uniref:Delta-aminolevulinic acid dehydratase n=1 Tax=Malassezia cuniculi TaxID=948313 RepID=A0AAF0JDF9_9BASI|nr:porphobilinogen synthase [Malassezia cuniculi]